MAFPLSKQRTRRHVSIAAFLTLLLLATWGTRALRQAHLQSDLPWHQTEAVRAALAEIETRFAQTQADMLALAQQAAGSEQLRAGLQALRAGKTGTELDQALETAVGYFAEGLAVPPRTAVEVYTPEPRLVAWNGFSTPLDPATADLFFMERLQTAVVNEEGRRQALVLWLPVREEGLLLGAVRVVRLVRARVPVENEYLQHYHIARSWEEATGLPVEAVFGPAPAAEGPHTRLLVGQDGAPLGRVTVTPPSLEALTAEETERFDHVIAFWAVLLAFWLFSGLWREGRRGIRAAVRQHSRPVLWYGLLRLALAGVGWWGLRYLLLALDVPARWFDETSPLAPLFDPQHLASGFAGGAAQSAADLLITALFGTAFAFGFTGVSGRLLGRKPGPARRPLPVSPLIPFLLVSAGAALVAVALVQAHRTVVWHAILDSTLDYFARTGLLPEPLILVVLCALLLNTTTVLILTVGVIWIAGPFLNRYRPPGLAIWQAVLVVFGTAVLCAWAVHAVLGDGSLLSWLITVAFLIGGGLAALYGLSPHRVGLLTLRSVLFDVLVVTVLTYPLLYLALDSQRRIQMNEALDEFAAGKDLRVVFVLEQVLREALEDPSVHRVLAAASAETADPAQPDSLVEELVSGSLLNELGDHEVKLTLFGPSGQLLGRYQETGATGTLPSLGQIDSTEFTRFRDMFRDSDRQDLIVETATGRREVGRFHYEGIAPIRSAGSETPLGWIATRAEPRPVMAGGETPFPRVLVPTGIYQQWRANFSLAEFREGVLVRTQGRDFGRFQLSTGVAELLATRPEAWQFERVNNRWYQTHYRLQEAAPGQAAEALLLPAGGPSIVAVRSPAVVPYDHLYYMLRVTVAGLVVGLPVYVIGLWLRRRWGFLPAPQVRFRDKVLDAFLGVGIVAVVAMGLIGGEAIRSESQRAVQGWLRQHLERVEDLLALEARGDELPYQVLDRIRIDSLAARLGLDLNVYRNGLLVESSRPQLARQRLIDTRLPISAYHALYLDGFRHAYAEAEVGNFTYTTGYRALVDEQGLTEWVVGVLTLPEQERIQEEQARTTAYLFGALLLLLLIVMITATILAGALSRPIGRLREGLQAVAEGRFERHIPVETRDEVGELVSTFNLMQEQLAESRLKLARQERELAWREMARQVAHEIKNPLTPMKLSVQHLRRAFAEQNLAGEADGVRIPPRFVSLFDRITVTLTEQIDTLARIANEFSSFARMPTRHLEKLDLNDTIEEAVALLQEDAYDAEIALDLFPGPLLVEADREELRRLYINLLKNALQAMPDGGQVLVRTMQETSGGTAWAFSSVTDTGLGIPEEVRERIFQPNFSTKTSGMGLGLAIVRKTVEDLRGEIDFTTEENRGTTFFVRIPLAG